MLTRGRRFDLEPEQFLFLRWSKEGGTEVFQENLVKEKNPPRLLTGAPEGIILRFRPILHGVHP